MQVFNHYLTIKSSLTNNKISYATKLRDSSWSNSPVKAIFFIRHNQMFRFIKVIQQSTRLKGI